MAPKTEHFSPPRPVEVLEGQAWHRGALRAWRRDGEGWLAFVDVTHRPGITFVRWVPAGQVRPLGTPRSPPVVG